MNANLSRLEKNDKIKKYYTLKLDGKKDVTEKGIHFYPTKIYGDDDIVFDYPIIIPSKYNDMETDCIEVDHAYNFLYDKRYNYVINRLFKRKIMASK